MSRSATPATRNEETPHVKPPKVTPSAELTIGTAIRPSRGRLRTVADGWATSSEHTLNHQTPRVKREPLLLRIWEKKTEKPRISPYLVISCHISTYLVTPCPLYLIINLQWNTCHLSTTFSYKTCWTQVWPRTSSISRFPSHSLAFGRTTWPGCFMKRWENSA